jgi:hypothetical protein
MPKKNGKSETTRQQKLIKLITDNLGNPEGTKTMYELMILAGYSPESARQQSNILAGVREDLEPIVARLKDHREEIITQMVKKISKAKYRDLTDALDKTTKNIQLLSGKATERPNNVITGLENLTDEQLDELIKDRKNRAG